MGRKKRKGGGSAPIKGFRPGKEPAHLRKRAARARLGQDASWAQKQAVELVADRSPEEVRRMMMRWTVGLLAAAAALIIAGAFLYGWAIWAGLGLHLVAAVLLFLWYRMRRQRAQLVKMAESFGKPPRR
jgi:Flp pilus assembly protein TadB